MDLKFRLRDSDPWEEYDGEGLAVIAIVPCVIGSIVLLLAWLLG